MQQVNLYRELLAQITYQNALLGGRTFPNNGQNSNNQQPQGMNYPPEMLHNMLTSMAGLNPLAGGLRLSQFGALGGLGGLSGLSGLNLGGLGSNPNLSNLTTQSLNPSGLGNPGFSPQGLGVAGGLGNGLGGLIPNLQNIQTLQALQSLGSL